MFGFCSLTRNFRFQRRITLAMKIHWHMSWTLTCTIVISKKHRQCQNHNGNPCCLAAIVWGTSKRSTAIIFFKNCRTQCNSQHPTNSRKVWSGTIAGEQCLRRQCEISIVCDDGSFSSPKKCALALSFSSPKECALAPGLAEGCCKATREQKEQTTDFK